MPSQGIGKLHKGIRLALLLAGSAILLYSCGESGNEEEGPDVEKLMTQQSDSLKIINSENGHKSYLFTTPLMERYELAKEPYMEFRKGLYIETYDSTGVKETSLVADYAIFFEKQKLWEAKGNVVATNAKGEKLETQQLFWNQRTKKVYSNVDSRVTQGSDVVVGEGFESDESFDEFVFRRPKGKVTVNIEPTENPDSTAVAAPQPAVQPVAPAPVPVPARPGNVTPRSRSTKNANLTPEERARRSEESKRRLREREQQSTAPK